MKIRLLSMFCLAMAALCQFGSILSAQQCRLVRAKLGAAGVPEQSAVNDVSRVQNELAGRLATVHGQFTAAKKRADRYRDSILPNASRSYELSILAFKAGQFEYLRVL